MEEKENIEMVLISQMYTLDTFDIVKLIDDETGEFKGYFLNPKYYHIIQDILDKKEALLEEFKKLSKNVSIIDKDIDIIKADEEMYGDVSFCAYNREIKNR